MSITVNCHLFKDLEDIIQTKRGWVISFLWKDQISFELFIKYDTYEKCYQLVWSKKNYTSKSEVLEDVRLKMKELWFKERVSSFFVDDFSSNSSFESTFIAEKHIWFDIDDTLVDFTKLLLEAFYKMKNIFVDHTTVSVFDLEDIIDITFEDIKTLVKDYDLYSKGCLSEEDRAVFRILKEQWHKVSFITSRFTLDWYDTIWLTKKWLQLQWLEGEVFFSSKKSEIITKEKIDIFIDDAYHNTIDIVKNTSTKSLLLNKSWNWLEEKTRLVNRWKCSVQDIILTDKKAIRIDSLSEIINHL